MFAGFVPAEAANPDLTVADHGSFRVDEEIFVLLFEDGVLDVGCDDVVIGFYEGLFVFDGEWLSARVDLDGVMDEGGYGGCVVFCYGLLECGEDSVDSGMVADGEVDGFVERG